MKNILLVLINLICLNIYCQNYNIKFIFNEANEAFQKKEYNKAKEKYLEVIALDQKHKDAFFNLAITVLNLNDIENACKYLNKSYQFGVFEAYDLIIENCGKLEYSEQMWRFDVDELPMFIKDDEIIPLFIETPIKNTRMTNLKINPEFIHYLRPEIKKDKELKRLEGRINVLFHFDISGRFQIDSMNGKIKESQKNKLAHILNNTMEFIPAKYNNKNVGIIEGLSLPLFF